MGSESPLSDLDWPLFFLPEEAVVVRRRWKRRISEGFAYSFFCQEKEVVREDKYSQSQTESMAQEESFNYTHYIFDKLRSKSLIV